MDWDERYSEDGFAYGIEPTGFLVSIVDMIPKGKILSGGGGANTGLKALRALALRRIIPAH